MRSSNCLPQDMTEHIEQKEKTRCQEEEICSKLFKEPWAKMEVMKFAIIYWVAEFSLALWLWLFIYDHGK